MATVDFMGEVESVLRGFEDEWSQARGSARLSVLLAADTTNELRNLLARSDVGERTVDDLLIAVLTSLARHIP